MFSPDSCELLPAPLFSILAHLTKSTRRILLNVLYCAKVNRVKAAGKYEKYRGYGDDRDPEFKFVLKAILGTAEKDSGTQEILY